MEHTYENGILIIRLPERIDGTSAAAVQEEIRALCEETSTEKLTFDCSAMKYISSAGLRVILSFQKKYPKLHLTEVSQDVYDIFETTGFTTFLNIRKQMKSASVEGCEIVGYGATCKVYRTDPETVYKVYKEGTDLTKVERERNISRKAFLLGIPTAISYDIVKVGNSYATVFEMLKAQSYSEILRSEPERIEECIVTYTDVLKKIHEITAEDDEFPDCKEVLLEKCDRLKGIVTEAELETIIGWIRRITDSDHLVHGDYHIGNIMFREGEIMLIDLESLSKGDPVFDLAGIYMAFVAFPEAEPGNLSTFFGITDELGRYFYDSFLDRYFEGCTEEERNEELRSAELIACIRIVAMTVAFKDHKRAGAIRTTFLPRLLGYLQSLPKSPAIG